MSSQLVDLHCHILPGIDDGAKNLDVSMSLIQKEMEDGVVGIVFTPHFHYERITLDALFSSAKWLIAALWRSWQNANFLLPLNWVQRSILPQLWPAWIFPNWHLQGRGIS